MTVSLTGKDLDYMLKLMNKDYPCSIKGNEDSEKHWFKLSEKLKSAVAGEMRKNVDKVLRHKVDELYGLHEENELELVCAEV